MRKPLSIARKDDLTDCSALSSAQKVKRVINFPYEYVLFEFWDDAYDKIYDPKKKYYEDPELKTKAAELRKQEESLLKPLFNRATPANFVSGIIFLLNDISYEFRMLRRERSIELNYFNNNAVNSECNLVANFKELTDKKKAAFEKVIADWIQWALGLALLKSCEPPVYEDKKAVLMIHFTEKFEDALAALIIMLNHTRLKTGVVKVVY